MQVLNRIISAVALLEYQAQSPDEGALVSAARNFGFIFLVRLTVPNVFFLFQTYRIVVVPSNLMTSQDVFYEDISSRRRAVMGDKRELVKTGDQSVCISRAH